MKGLSFVLDHWIIPALSVAMKELVVPLFTSTAPLVVFVYFAYTLLPVQVIQLLCLLVHATKPGIFARR